MATILVVDDNPTDRLLIRTVLAPLGHRVVEAAAADAAIELAASEKPDLILSDVLMPTLDGYGFARALRVNPSTRSMRLVFCTASAGEPGVEALAVATGALGVIPKPCEPKRIGDLVNQALAVETPVDVSLSEAFDREHVRLINDQLVRKVQDLEGAKARLEIVATELERRASQQLAITRIGATALSGCDLDGLMVETARVSASSIGAPYAAICQIDEHDGRLFVRASFGWNCEEVLGVSLDPGPRSQCGLAVATGVPVVTSDLRSEVRFEVHPKLVLAGVLSSLAVPIHAADAICGALVVHATNVSMFTDEDVSFCEALGHIVGEAMYRDRTTAILARADRLDSLGHLAGGVAHDFGNIIQVVTGYLRLIEKNASDDRIKGFVDEANSACDRALGLTKQLLTFAKTNEYEREHFDVADVVKEMEPLLRQAAGSHVALTVECAPGSIVDAGRTEIEQILLNLVVNARDAMPGGGDLAVTTETAAIDESFALRHPETSLKPGRYALIRVTDSGTGMTEDVQRRIFEPFFTTKDKDVGTGLGLATVYGTTTHLGGFVDVASEVGFGTTFSVFIPTLGGVDERSAVERPGPGGTILVVEDGEVLRSLVCEVLETEGFEAVAAATPADAIAVLGRDGQQLDAALIDLVLPEMSGRTLVERAREMRPSLPVVLMSGFALSALSDVEHASVVMLQKPFGPEELVDALGRARTGGRAPSP